MRILITAGPTREPVDSVRFLTNASSGRMGFALAAAALGAGHDVTLLAGPVALAPPPGAQVRRFVTVAELKSALAECFPNCDALLMAAAVGDFRVEAPRATKIARRDGAVTVRLIPTEDLLAGVAAGKRPDQTIVAFAVEDGSSEQIEAKARGEMADKAADLVVVNTPAAMAAAESLACILAPDRVILPWARRSKDDLARALLQHLDGDCALP